MSLKDQIRSDIKESMKIGDKHKVSVLRMLLSELQYAQTAGQTQTELDDASVLKVISAYHKRLLKSQADFPEGEKRDEIQSEIDVVSHYLPKKLSPDELDQVIEEELKQASDKNFGVLMKQLVAKLGLSVDGKLLSQKLKEKLETSS